MAASRTGTTHWLKLAAQAKRLAQAQGQTQCPWCQARINYHRGLTPTSAEADHIVPHALGGTDTLDNIRIICLRCNQSKGANTAPKRKLHLHNRHGFDLAGIRVSRCRRVNFAPLGPDSNKREERIDNYAMFITA